MADDHGGAVAGLEPNAVLVTGACPEGAEELAAECWRDWGGVVERWPFDWDQPQGTVVSSRHRQMIEAGVEVCLVFGGAFGPDSLPALARASRVSTHEWTPGRA